MAGEQSPPGQIHIGQMYHSGIEQPTLTAAGSRPTNPNGYKKKPLFEKKNRGS
jgi:hypothetical protein